MRGAPRGRRAGSTNWGTRDLAPPVGLGGLALELKRNEGRVIRSPTRRGRGETVGVAKTNGHGSVSRALELFGGSLSSGVVGAPSCGGSRRPLAGVLSPSLPATSAVVPVRPDGAMSVAG